MTPLVFDVAGVPVPQGSAKAFNRRGGGQPIVTHDAKGLPAWRNAIANAARLAKRGDTTLLTGPVAIRLHFRVTRPASHYRANGELKASAPEYPTTRPDSDKLDRAVRDALTGVVFVDDAQVSASVVRKDFAERGHQPGVLVEVGERQSRRSARNETPAAVGLGL